MGRYPTREGVDMKKSKLNRGWHLSHRMPPKATLEQRLEWHLEHAKNCQCRAITGKIAEEMKKRGMSVPNS
jgi:hypothetical protein